MVRFTILFSVLVALLASVSIHGQVTASRGQGGSWRTGMCVDDGDVDALEVICTVEVLGYSSLTLQGEVASSAFTDFNSEFSNDGLTYVTLYDVAANYSAPAGSLCDVSENPTTWSTTTIILRFCDLGGYKSLRFRAAGTNSDPTLTWMLQ